MHVLDVTFKVTTGLSVTKNVCLQMSHDLGKEGDIKSLSKTSHFVEQGITFIHNTTIPRAHVAVIPPAVIGMCTLNCIALQLLSLQCCPHVLMLCYHNQV